MLRTVYLIGSNTISMDTSICIDMSRGNPYSTTIETKIFLISTFGDCSQSMPRKINGAPVLVALQTPANRVRLGVSGFQRCILFQIISICSAKK